MESEQPTGSFLSPSLFSQRLGTRCAGLAVETRAGLLISFPWVSFHLLLNHLTRLDVEKVPSSPVSLSKEYLFVFDVGNTSKSNNRTTVQKH